MVRPHPRRSAAGSQNQSQHPLRPPVRPAPLGYSRATARYFQRRTGRIFDTVDVVLAPTTATPPPKIGAMADLDANGLSRAMVQACPYAWPWNTLGWPAINVPAGFTDDGLPLGAQLLGPANSEELLISLAAQLESRERWQNHRPPPR